jgi:hypothetical protein
MILQRQGEWWRFRVAMAVISLKLAEALDAQLTEQAHRHADLLADSVGYCEGETADLTSNPAY